MIFVRLQNQNVTFHIFKSMPLISTNLLKKQVIRTVFKRYPVKSPMVQLANAKSPTYKIE